MIVYYAIGGGRGHVTRARRVLAALDVREAIIVASIDAPGALRIPPELEQSLDAHRRWIRGLGATRIIADSFPLGIRGELAEIGVPLDHVARLLRWDAYRAAVAAPLPRFGTTWIVEPLAADHDTAVRAASERVVELSLQAEDVKPAACVRPYRLVVHSGPAEEVRELVAYAEERRAIDASRARIVVATACDVDGIERVDADPPSALFAGAERIVSAAGFNVMLETERWRQKHDVVPFARRFDDQFARAARRRASQRQVEETFTAEQPAAVDHRGRQRTSAATHHATS